jgi:hypothetical protein
MSIPLLKQYAIEQMQLKLSESGNDNSFKNISLLGYYTKTVEKVKVSGNTLSLSIEDENGYGVDITYTMKKTPKGITVSGEWERHTSSMSTRNSIGNTKPKSFKDMNEVLTAFAKALNKTDLEALKKINI